MSLRRNIPEMIAEKMPQKGNGGRIDDTGLRKRPQFEQIINYLECGQEHVVYPDRQAKLIRNHPYMTQLDFFEMQDDQKRQWEAQKEQQQVSQVAEEFNLSAAQVRAMPTRNADARSTGTQSDPPVNNNTQNTPNPGSSSSKSGRQAASSSSAPAAAQNPVFTVASRSSRMHSAAQPGTSLHHRDNLWGTYGSTYHLTGIGVRGQRPPQEGYGPMTSDNSYRQPPPPPPTIAVHVAHDVAMQDIGVNEAAAAQLADARKRLEIATLNERAKRERQCNNKYRPC